MQIPLLHSVSSYVSRIGIPASLLDNFYLASKGDVTSGDVSCTNYQTASLHQIRSMVYVLTDLNIDAALDRDPETDLLGPFIAADADMEYLCVRKII